MAKKIFYNPKTLQIMGMSDGENSMDYPYLETEVDYHSTTNLGIEVVDEETCLKILKGTL